jgi:glutathione S-transferase
MNIDPWHVFTLSFGTFPKPSTGFVTLLDMGLYFYASTLVSLARGKYKVDAPATEGPQEFMRIHRVHMNMTEQLVFHLPLLWLAAFAMDDVFAAAFGAVWLFGRVLYARGYYKKAKRRAKGFIITTIVNAILGVGALAGIVASF